ncbi:hypothetical protein HDU76_001494 [Blyttiomyces sp. JEL0837]|nr:hypothetical protein HDU76_001494 [Blyttiomyces sp. JEL0837]
MITIPSWLTLLLLSSCAGAKRPNFPRSGLYSVDVGIDNVDGTIAAFGDFNADKMTDLFILNNKQDTVILYLWNRQSYQFEVSTKAQAQISTSDSSSSSGSIKIRNVVPGDFNRDGRLDVLLMGTSSKNPAELIMSLHLGNGADEFIEEIKLPSSTLGQPILIDFYGNMSYDLLGYTFKNPEQLSLWQITQNGTALLSVPVFDNTTAVCSLPDLHSSGFVDLDGDCLADLFLTCRDKGSSHTYYQIWLNKKGGNFKFKTSGVLPDGAGQISFADMDADGTTDLVFPACSGKGKCALHVAYNTQVPLCTSSITSNCRSTSDLCVSDDSFVLNFEDTGVPMHGILPDNEDIVLRFDDQPSALRIGDFNADGYPDILLLSANSSNTVMRLLQSQGCVGESCGQKGLRKRGFSLVSEGGERLDSISGSIRAAAFFDLDEDGNLDIIATRVDPRTGQRSNIAILNNFFNDAFFLKTLVSNGVCSSATWCSNEIATPNAKPYGVNYFGASFKFTVVDTMGHIRATQFAQMPQTGYFALNTPYNFMGLGRTNNYIDILFVGTTRNQPQHVATYQGVIPNSQLIVLPYQPAGIKDTST